MTHISKLAAAFLSVLVLSTLGSAEPVLRNHLGSKTNPLDSLTRTAKTKATSVNLDSPLALPIPAGTVLEHINATVGPDGIGRRTTDTGPAGPLITDQMLVPIYVGTETGSTYFFPPSGNGSGMWYDLIPYPGLGLIQKMELGYWATGGASNTVSVDIAFYKDGNGPADHSPIKDITCSPLGSFMTSFTIGPLPAVPSIVTFSTPCIAIDGPFYVGLQYHTTGGVVGAILMSGSNTGVGLGKFTEFPYCNFVTFDSSPGDSDNSLLDPLGNCVQLPINDLGMANFMMTLLGNMPWEFKLAEDYAINGPAYTPQQTVLERDKVLIGVHGPSGYMPDSQDLVTVYTNPIFGTTWGGLPFSAAACGTPSNPTVYDICFERQDGYLSSLAQAQHPNQFLNCGGNPGTGPTTYTYMLHSGDVTGDDSVNLLDLAAVLMSMGLHGQCP